MADFRLADGLIVDLFAGAGGWDEGLRQLGYEAVGIDNDQLACTTARAAGHERIEGNVAQLDPRSFGPAWGLIASPPCQAYSTAGKGLGRIDKPHVIACAHELAAGNDTRPEHRAACLDERSLLTVEPLRWTLALRPRWVAMEQVPPVLELWTLFAGLLAVHGYQTAVGVLRSEQYGVPQARRRAFLIASLDGPVRLPEPTHQSFDPRRHSVPESERHLPQWVSMAQALGWSEPAIVHTNNQTDSGRRPQGLTRSLDRPAHTLDTASGSWTIEPTPAGPRWRLAAGRVPEACERHARERQARASETQVDDVPAWAQRRPSTTVLGNSYISPPGYWPRPDAPHGSVRPQRVRITVEQAATLQGFRHDYPWQGSRTQRFTQIGNAVCPPLARHVLREAIRPSRPDMTERRR